MVEDVVYVIDSSSFIDAKNRYYAFDFAPRFWTSLVEQARDGLIESIDRIKSELDQGNDELTKWADVEFLEYFVSTDDISVTTSYGEVMNWVNAQNQYLPAAKADFANDPDAWLIAYAIAKQRVVVTQEVSAPDSKIKVKIPDVCLPFSLTCIDTFELIRRLGIKWE